MINGFGSASAVSGQQYGSAGAGAILLGITGIGMLTTSIITFLPQHRLTPQPPAPPYPQQGQYPPQQPYPQQPPQGQKPQGGQGHPPYPPQQGPPPQQF